MADIIYLFGSINDAQPIESDMSLASYVKGEKGDPGKSAYEVALDNGYVGTQAQWLASLVGPQGTNGINGSTFWTTTTAPASPNYTFTKSNLTGNSNLTPQVGDEILYSYYRYTIDSVDTTTVHATSRVSIRGATGATYTITQNDYTAIANVVISQLGYAENGSY